MAKIKNVTEENVSELARQYLEFRKQKKAAEDRMKEIATALKDYAVKNGVEDSNGSTYVEIGGYRFGNQAKTKVSFNDSAIPYLKGKGMTDCIETIERVNESVFEAKVNSGDITVEDISEITSSDVTYAIDVKKLEAQEFIKEVVISKGKAVSRDLPMAASKKPKGFKRV